MKYYKELIKLKTAVKRPNFSMTKFMTNEKIPHAFSTVVKELGIVKSYYFKGWHWKWIGLDPTKFMAEKVDHQIKFKFKINKSPVRFSFEKPIRKRRTISILWGLLEITFSYR